MIDWIKSVLTCQKLGKRGDVSYVWKRIPFKGDMAYEVTENGHIPRKLFRDRWKMYEWIIEE